MAYGNEDKGNDPTDSELADVKRKLKAGKLERNDLAVLEALVERTEQAAKKLRAAIVE